MCSGRPSVSEPTKQLYCPVIAYDYITLASGTIQNLHFIGHSFFIVKFFQFFVCSQAGVMTVDNISSYHNCNAYHLLH